MCSLGFLHVVTGECPDMVTSILDEGGAGTFIGRKWGWIVELYRSWFQVYWEDAGASMAQRESALLHLSVQQRRHMCMYVCLCTCIPAPPKLPSCLKVVSSSTLWIDIWFRSSSPLSRIPHIPTRTIHQATTKLASAQADQIIDLRGSHDLRQPASPTRSD